MNKRHPYNHIIVGKLEQLPGVDADHLWNDMHAILDKEMPQKKERRRFIGWFLTGKGILLLAVVSVIITGSSLFFLSTKENSTLINKLSNSRQSNNSSPNGTEIGSQESKSNISTDNTHQKTTNDISTATFSPNAADYAIANNSRSQQTKQHFEKYAATEKFNHPIQTDYIAETSDNMLRMNVSSLAINNSKDETNFDITTVNLNSIHQDLPITGQNSQQQNQTAKANTKNNEVKGFYAGIVSGVDLSSIHLQSLKTGATKGLIVGYAFNEKWSIESGLLWDKKRFHDNGSYFSPPGYTPTTGTTITAVNGISRLYEWPVNVKYVILAKRHSLFATAGLSSYYMRRENYDYEYMQNNQPGGHNYLSYENETKNWFSVASISLGYAHKLGAIGSIRVEPYLKLPIKKLGVGNMPIMSTGLNIGLTKPLTR
jgi:hypothetical protein